MIQHYNCICLQNGTSKWFFVVLGINFSIWCSISYTGKTEQKVLKLLLSSAETERNLTRNSLGSLGSLENLGAQARSNLCSVSAIGMEIKFRYARNLVGLLENFECSNSLARSNLRSVSALLLSLDLNQSSSTIKTWNKSCLNCTFIMQLVLDVANAMLKFLDGNRVSCSFCRHNFR